MLRTSWYFYFTLPPETVGTSTEPPSEASTIEIGTLQKISVPFLPNIGCSVIFTNKYKSPGEEPFCPTAPSPDKRILLPSSTPAGIFTSNFLFFLLLPSPLHVLQGSVITCPAPPHEEHVLSTVKNP